MASGNRSVRFKADRNLERMVEMTAGGMIATGRQTTTRKRRTTLERISDEMAEEARKFARAYPQRERRSYGGLQKTAPRHPFDRSNPNTETYIKSIRALEPKHVGGRLSIQIIAAHPNADDVEFGNAGGVVKRVHSTGKRFALPIHKWKYDQLQKQRNMSLKRRRAAGWPSAQPDMRKVYNQKFSTKRSAQNPREFEKMRVNETPTQFLRRRDKWRERQDRMQRRARNVAVASRAMRGRLSSKPRIFTLGPDSPIPSARHYMLVTRFETYSEYGILRRAMNHIAIKHFE